MVVILRSLSLTLAVWLCEGQMNPFRSSYGPSARFRQQQNLRASNPNNYGSLLYPPNFRQGLRTSWRWVPNLGDGTRLSVVLLTLAHQTYRRPDPISLEL